MLQLQNKTPFTAGLCLFPDENAIDSLYIMVKANFDMDHTAALAQQQLPLTEADVYYGEPGASSLKYPSDYHPGKPATDIILLGSACSIDQQPVKKLDVELSVGNLQKRVRVFGDRHWQNGRITPPKPFETMRMRYEKAFGGQSEDTAEPLNPVGTGYKGKSSNQRMEGVALPNLENPTQLIIQDTDTPEPACFAAIAPNWMPRANSAGTYDQEWENSRAPYLPQDYSPQFMNCAAHGLIYPGFITGGEKVYIANMHPAGPLNFNLPKISLHGSANIAGSSQVLSFVAETLIFEPNQLQFSINWRAKLICGKQISKISDIAVWQINQ